MSVNLHVFLERKSMPTPPDWAKAIIDAGFDADLDSDFDVDRFCGFLPCRFEGAESGFEYLAGPIESADGLSLPENFDFEVTFSTHSNRRELSSSVVAAAVLCKVTNGVLFDPQAGDRVTAEQATAWARELLAEIDL